MADRERRDQGPLKPARLEDVDSDEGPKALNWHVVRTLSNENVARLKFAKAGKHWNKTRKSSARMSSGHKRGLPEHLRPHALGPGRAHDYRRMRDLSKGRFGHPSQLRTLSVREAALLQTFPPDYIFDTPYMEYVCNIIGNALPVDFAQVLAKQCVDVIEARSKRALRTCYS